MCWFVSILLVFNRWVEVFKRNVRSIRESGASGSIWRSVHFAQCRDQGQPPSLPICPSSGKSFKRSRIGSIARASVYLPARKHASTLQTKPTTTTTTTTTTWALPVTNDQVPRAPHRALRGRVRVAHGVPPRQGRHDGGPCLRRKGQRDLRRVGEAVRALRAGAGGDGQEVRRRYMLRIYSMIQKYEVLILRIYARNGTVDR